MDQHRGKLSLSQWQPLHVTAEEKRAVELRYLSLHQLHLFYEQKTVTDLEANSCFRCVDHRPFIASLQAPW